MPGATAAKPFPGNPLQMVIDVTRPLPRGVYTVNWKTVSALDGHVASGSMLFGVRENPPQVSQFGKSLGSTSRWLTGASATGRWLLYLGLALLVGAAGTCIVCFRDRLPAGGRPLLRGAWLLGAVGLAVIVLAEKAAVGAPSLLPLLQTSEGHAYVNLGSALVVCLVAVILVDLWPNRWTFATLAATGALAMLIHVLAGHADAVSPRLLNLLAQWIHIVAVGLWIGGLVWLLFGVRVDRSIDRRSAVTRFSTMAGIALGVVVVTGVLRAWAEVGSLHALVSTSYGATLFVKVALVVIIALLGALNRYRQVPALLADDGRLRSFQLTARGELALAAAVLAATAVLTGLNPAATAAKPVALTRLQQVAAAPAAAHVTAGASLTDGALLPAAPDRHPPAGPPR